MNTPRPLPIARILPPCASCPMLVGLGLPCACRQPSAETVDLPGAALAIVVLLALTGMIAFLTWGWCSLVGRL